MAITTIQEVLIQFVPTMQFAQTPEGKRLSGVFAAPAHMPLPSIGEQVSLGRGDEQFRVVSRSFGFPTPGEGQTVQVFYGVEPVNAR